jgi:hypothetical protein
MNQNGMDKGKGNGTAGMPSILPQPEYENVIADNYTVKYFRGDLDEPGEILELQRIETTGLRGDDIVLCDRQTYSFEGRFFVVLRYYQKRI